MLCCLAVHSVSASMSWHVHSCTHTRTDQGAHIAVVYTRANTPVASNFKFKCNQHFHFYFHFHLGERLSVALFVRIVQIGFSKHEQIRTFMRWTCRISFTFRSSFPTHFNGMHPECMCTAGKHTSVRLLSSHPKNISP